MCTSRRHQIVDSLLATTYSFALVQSAVFLSVFSSHLSHPVTTSLCLALFQIACFHVATATAIFAGNLSETMHHRLRWMILGAFFFMTALYLRLAWDLRIVPHFLTTSGSQLLFYPAVMMTE